MLTGFEQEQSNGKEPELVERAKTLGRELKLLRKSRRKNWSKSTVAAWCAICRHFLVRIETGKRFASYATLRKLAECYGYSSVTSLVEAAERKGCS
jgi:hypothetical protein